MAPVGSASVGIVARDVTGAVYVRETLQVTVMVNTSTMYRDNAVQWLFAPVRVVNGTGTFVVNSTIPGTVTLALSNSRAVTGSDGIAVNVSSTPATVSWVGSVSESEAPPSRSGYVLGTFVFVDVGSCAVLDYEDTRLRDVVAIAADYTLLDPLNVTVADRTCESTGRRRQSGGGYEVTLKLRFVATLENLAWVSRLVASLTQEAGLGSGVSRFTLALDTLATTGELVGCSKSPIACLRYFSPFARSCCIWTLC